MTAAFEGLPLLQAARAKARSAAEPKPEAAEGASVATTQADLHVDAKMHAPHLPYISPLSPLYLQVELDDFNTHLKPHRTDKLGQLYRLGLGLGLGLAPG